MWIFATVIGIVPYVFNCFSIIKFLPLEIVHELISLPDNVAESHDVDFA